jgi:hypothetical protein
LRDASHFSMRRRRIVAGRGRFDKRRRLIQSWRRTEESELGDWIPIERWAECVAMEKPGIIFELRNEDGLSLYTPCILPLPNVPFDWRRPPTEFRAIPEPRPVHSTPLPLPKT